MVSLFTHDPNIALQSAIGLSAWHGRVYINNRDSAQESTGHGAPLPHMIHGGPGRAGASEEMGGIRGVLHHMQRTAIQGSPDMLSAITGDWITGSKILKTEVHPFRKRFDELLIGETLITESRTISNEDIQHFADFTGDQFYAHTDTESAKANPFFPDIVAHGYLLLSFAAGLFVEPSPGPVLANTGLKNLSFQKPVVAGEQISVQLSVRHKTPRVPEYGEVTWYARIFDSQNDTVAEYELLTMVAK